MAHSQQNPSNCGYVCMFIFSPQEPIRQMVVHYEARDWHEFWVL